MNSADQGGCYPQRLKAEVDITLANSSYPTKAEFNNIALLFIQNISLFLKEFLPFRSLLPTKNSKTSSPGFLSEQFNNLLRAALLTSF